MVKTEQYAITMKETYKNLLTEWHVHMKTLSKRAKSMNARLKLSGYVNPHSDLKEEHLISLLDSFSRCIPTNSFNMG